MLDAIFGFRVEGINHHCPMGDATEGQGRNELGGAVTHDDIY